MPDIFPLDSLTSKVTNWLHLIDHARRNPDGEIVPSFLEIIDQISSDLDSYLKDDSDIKNVKSIFIGISVIQYLNERYAIEKVMMFAKGRCRVSLQTPSMLSSQLIDKFDKYITEISLDQWLIGLGKSLSYILHKDFQAARSASFLLIPKFKEKYQKSQLFLIETLIYSLNKPEIIPLLIQNLNKYLNKFANNPISQYFLIIKNLVIYIQSLHSQNKLSLQWLLNFFNNLSQLEE